MLPLIILLYSNCLFALVVIYTYYRMLHYWWALQIFVHYEFNYIRYLTSSYANFIILLYFSTSNSLHSYTTCGDILFYNVNSDSSSRYFYDINYQILSVTTIHFGVKIFSPIILLYLDWLFTYNIIYTYYRMLC